MTRSVNEIESLARKAATGAGFPPAQAESFGRAAVLHLASGGAAEALTDALGDPADSPILRLPLLVEDLWRALALAGPEVALSLQPGDESLAPAYARLLPVALRAVRVVRQPDGPARIEITAIPDKRHRPDLPARIEAPDALVERLTRLAERTYGSATENSRTSGAGAGNIDTD